MMNWNEPEDIRTNGLHPLEKLNNILKKHLYNNYNMRGMTVFLMDYYKDRTNLVGVEIGVLEGMNSLVMLQNLGIMKLYCIDPYLCYDNYDLYDELVTPFLKAKENLKSFEEQVVFVKKLSSSAIDDIPRYNDFVYIDGNHSYDFVKKDIELYYPRVREGGVFGGHDFHAMADKDYGVARAVLEFVDKEGLQLFGKRSMDWWVIKK